MTSIGDEAFERCSGLTTIAIPESMTSIGYSVFYNCSGLTSIIIPNSVTSIGVEAFCGCSRLTDVYCYAEEIPNTNNYAFSFSSYRSATLHVPAGSVSQYRTTSPWSGFGTIVALTDEDAIGEAEADVATDVECYDIQGRKIAKPQKGINIIRYSDGTSKKVLIK